MFVINQLHMFELFVIISIIIVTILTFVSYYVTITNYYDETKLSTYECGFDPFINTRIKFDIKFYMVSILFIIFDLEIIFIFPIALTINVINIFEISIFFIFITILTIGFIYEWQNGALEWLKFIQSLTYFLCLKI